jgi:carboxylesterase type B
VKVTIRAQHKYILTTPPRPIIDGANTDEGTAFGPTGINTTADFTTYSTVNASNLLPSWLVPDLLAAYPLEPDYYIPPTSEVSANATFPAEYGVSDQYRRSAAYYGDVVMIANRRGTVETWAANGVPAYSYRFNTIPAGIPWYVGVTHFQEVAFVFDNIDGYGYNPAHSTINPFENKTQSYYHLAKLMSQSWASFIYDQNPNNFTGRYAGAAEWPVYSTSAPQNIVWDANATELAYAEPDTFREEGIRFILDHALAYNR